MKKVNFKNVLTALVLALAFVVAGVQETNAQALTDFNNGVFSPPPTGNFVTSAEAQTRLMAEMTNLKGQLENLSGTAYTAAERKYLYYYGINTSIIAGKDVPESIVEGFLNLNDVNGHGNTTNAQATALRQEAIDLLEN